MPHTERAVVRLRPVDAGDGEDVHRLLSDWEVVRYMLLPLGTREESGKFLREAMEESASQPWRSLVRAIVHTPDGFAGLCGIVALRGAEEGEIWYLVDPRWWGRGLATAAAAALLQFGFEELGLHRMWAACLPENPASARVLEKVGMRREGLCRKNLKIHGEWKDSYLYAMLAEEWRVCRITALHEV